MSNYARKIFASFLSSIDEMVANPEIKNQMTVSNNNFIRHRKLPLKDVIASVVLMAGKPIREEIYDYFNCDMNAPSTSAYVQARDKLTIFAFEELFHRLNKNNDQFNKTFRGYHLIAVDGSELAISLDKSDKETFHNEGKKGCNLYHLNCAYDVLNKNYTDIIINNASHTSEAQSMYQMIERDSYKSSSIYMGDRAFATFNNMEHIIKSNALFLMRTKDICSANGFLHNLDLPNEEFDIDINLILTTKQTKDIKADKKYKFLSTSSTFDYMNKENPFYSVHYRIVRFKLEGAEEYEALVTNLPRESFSPSDLKYLYSLRWGIEVSFKHLKYATDLLSLHSKKRTFIMQEIWARLIFYNLTMIIVNHLNEQVAKKTNGKWDYCVNVIRTVHLIRDFIKRKGGLPPNFDNFLCKELLPIRPDRKFDRNPRPIGFMHFNYRCS